MGELDAFFLIQLEGLICGDSVDRPRLELIQQLQILLAEVIDCIPAF